MSVGYARPKVTELVFHLYGRSVHPELLDVYAHTLIDQDEFQAVLSICEAGHSVSLSCRGETATEVTTSKNTDMPKRKRYLEQRLRGHRDESYRFENGVQYHASFQLERLDADVFRSFHEELLIDCERADVSYQFPVGSRLNPGPLSLIRSDAGPRSLLVHAFHTFPDECAVVKTQSLFEF
ncbi:MAG: DUF2617 family protein [Planctomycetota bacterium]|nr:DUF2617 family protein [Planctomycetota bacterium]